MPSQSITLHYEGKIPSSNTCYYTDKLTNTRHLTKKGKAFKKAIKSVVLGQLAMAQWYKLTIGFSLPLLTAKGEPRKWDVTNHIKILEDSMCEKLGVDDKRVLKVEAEKTDGPHAVRARIEVV